MKTKIIMNSRLYRYRGKRLTAVLRRKFADTSFDIVPTAYPGHATDISRQAVRQGVDTVVVVGGDGTINEVLNGIMASDVALGIIPAGTANDLASYYGLPRNIDKACDIILKRHLHLVDVICVNGWHYLTAGGIGAPVDAAAMAEVIKRQVPFGRMISYLLGSRIYVFTLLHTFLNRMNRFGKVTIRMNDKSIISDSFSLLVMNQPTLGQRFRVSPQANNSDGLLDICLIEQSRSCTYLLKTIANTVRGRHIGMQGVRYFQSKSLSISTVHPVAFFGDGEIHQHGTSFDVRVIPSALRVIVPNGEEGC